ncbi:MAG: OmpA family protein [Archangium sp.]|nr:OmpA family protein [Archangium sp.]
MRLQVPTAVLLCVVAVQAVAAEDPFARGFDAVPIKFSPTMDPGLSLDGAELRPQGSWQLMPILDFNVGVLALKAGDQRLGDLIPFRTDLHIMGAYQLFSRLEVAADLPISLVNIGNFSLLTAQGFPQDNPRVIGLGAMRAQARFQILRQSEIPIVGLAAIGEIRFPTGDGFSFMGDRGVVFAPRLAAERTFGPVRILANAGWKFRTAPGRYLNLYVGHEFVMGGGVQISIPDIGALQSNQLLGEINLATPAEAPFTFRDAEALKTPLELLVGLRSMVAAEWGVMVAVGRGLGENGYGRETFRFTLGVRYERIPPADGDGDDIPDKIDQCPNEPEDKDGYQDGDGCPEPNPEPDTDGDGILDRVDGCPEAAGPAPLDGCPDKDQDQIPDNADQCPDQPGPAELNGCPPPEEEEDVVLESERIRIRNQVLYEFGSARIDKQSFPLLDEVAKVLLDNMDVGPVLIEGHTDNVGPRAFNIDLSRRRAKAVEDYLIEHGVETRRLRSEGFGFDKPIAPNDTPLNRAKNRRTEFRLVDEIEIDKPPQRIEGKKK